LIALLSGHLEALGVVLSRNSLSTIKLEELHQLQIVCSLLFRNYLVIRNYFQKFKNYFFICNNFTTIQLKRKDFGVLDPSLFSW